VQAAKIAPESRTKSGSAGLTSRGAIVYNPLHAAKQRAGEQWVKPPSSKLVPT
jgi:hypothetical protein